KSLDILSTDAQRVAAEINKLSNLITVDIGQATLKGFANLSQFTGGVDNLTAVVQNAGPVLATGTALLGAYAAAALAGARGNAAFAASFRGVSAGLLLLAGAYSGGDLIGRRLIDAI